MTMKIPADIRSRLEAKSPSNTGWKRALQNAGLTTALVFVLLSA